MTVNKSLQQGEKEMADISMTSVPNKQTKYIRGIPIKTRVKKSLL